MVSFYIDDLHFNLGVKLLNDKFGIQTRGGCSCAGTYGHYLLNIDPGRSHHITDLIDKGDYSEKPGWIRVSLHPTMTDEEVTILEKVLLNWQKITWSGGKNMILILPAWNWFRKGTTRMKRLKRRSQML